MTTAPFEPDPPDREEIPAADPGPGAPEPAPGFGPAEIDRDPVNDSADPTDSSDPADTSDSGDSTGTGDTGSRRE